MKYSFFNKYLGKFCGCTFTGIFWVRLRTRTFKLDQTPLATLLLTICTYTCACLERVLVECGVDVVDVVDARVSVLLHRAAAVVAAVDDVDRNCVNVVDDAVALI